MRHRLAKNGIVAFRDGVEGWVVVRGGVSRGAEEGEAGDELEGVDTAAHQLFEREAAGDLVADGGADFFVAGAEERVAQV